MDAEIIRLRRLWTNSSDGDDEALIQLLGAEVLATIDPFDRVQLAEAIRVCRASRSLSEAGRSLFSVSRTRRNSANDAYRLRKYLARFDLSWSLVATPS